MRARVILSAALILTGSVLLAACSGRDAREEPPYRSVPLSERLDPLAPGRDSHPAWRPPRPFAVYVHPHEDSKERLLVGGHWILLLLGEGSWYTGEEIEREPVPDGEASPEEIRRGTRSLVPGDAVVPVRKKE